jgi:hypothetical protein
MKKKFKILTFSILAVLVTHHVQAARSIEKKVYVTEETNPHAPVIDGKLDEACWQRATWEKGFVQRDPYEGEPPSQDTAFKILYDAGNLYVAIRALDTEPDRIEKRVTRRDDQQGDRVAVSLDSYFDHRTAFVFNINAAGVKSDYLISENGDNLDSGWDPIWHAAAHLGQDGWTAEMQIPFSQLRFGSQQEQVWGMQIWRFLHRKEELSGWQLIPKDASGLVHLHGELHGIQNVKSHRQIELLPYIVAQTERFESEEGNPFATGRDHKAEVGLDGKLAVTSDLTLNFTVNPDFGQVEADPSVVNLTTQEVFFVERRPFFIEGRNILNFQVMGGDGDFSQDNLFYSRRIGRPPQHDPDTEDHEYVRSPEYTSILGAFKLTGKTKNGTSIGVMESLTAREVAEIDSYGERRDEVVEPFTSYFLGRVQKDWDQGNTIIGGMFTATNRKIEDPQLAYFHRAAYTGGLDFRRSWKDQTYVFSAKSLFSRVRGDAEAIQETQESSVHYFQRPDATHVSVDPTRTSLDGHGGTLSFGKEGDGRIRFSLGGTWRSPGLELNDVGFLRQADRIMQWSWAGYRVLEPFSIFREVNVNANQWRGWDFSGENLFDGGNVNGGAKFKNYWRIGAGINRQGESLSTTMLRGGPALRRPGGWGNWVSLGTDGRKKLRFHAGGWNFWGEEDSRRHKEIWFGATYRPSNALTVMVEPNIGTNRQELQYVSTEEFGDQDRYILAHIDQKTVGITIRLNYSITPNLSIQYYGQPFISTGDYTQFKRITHPRADAYGDRFQTYTDSEISYEAEENEYHVDETGDGMVDYSFSNPNFNFRQFRSNLVLRWEYSPGSTLYVVWSQDRTNEVEQGDFNFGRDMDDLFRVAPHNVFLVKFSRWFSF